MTDASPLIQPHAAAIIGALVEALDAPDGWARLKAAKQLLRWGCGEPARRRRGMPEVAAGSGADMRVADQQRALDVLLPHLRPAKVPNRAATSCPARHADAEAPKAPPEPAPSPLAAPPGAESLRRDADPMSRRLLPFGHGRDDAFYRPLPPPPPVEPPWPHAAERPPYRRPRWG